MKNIVRGQRQLLRFLAPQCHLHGVY